MKLLFEIAAIELDPDNWKGHWRKGVALMSLAKRQFRTKQAIEAFEICAACSTLPANKRGEVQNELAKARSRMEQQDAEVIVVATTEYILFQFIFSVSPSGSEQMRTFLSSSNYKIHKFLKE